jgi:ribosome-binding factor A
VASKTDLRYVPSIFFRIDETYAEVAKIEALLRDPKVQEDLNKPDEEEEE